MLAKDSEDTAPAFFQMHHQAVYSGHSTESPGREVLKQHKENHIGGHHTHTHSKQFIARETNSTLQLTKHQEPKHLINVAVWSGVNTVYIKYTNRYKHQ